LTVRTRSGSTTTSSSTSSPVPCMKSRSSRQPVEDPIQETRSSSSSPFASQEQNANKKYYQPLFKNFEINLKQVPTKWDIKAFAEQKLGSSNFNDGDVRRVRSRFDYLRNQKRSIQTLSHYPGTRPSSNELKAHLKKAGWYTKDTFNMV
ncbi:hypothetical protein ACJMK2_028794, partial [Sinanodonta woodiana]